MAKTFDASSGLVTKIVTFTEYLCLMYAPI